MPQQSLTVGQKKLSKNGRMKLGHARKGHIPCSMKMTVDSVEISSLPTVTCHCQITSPLHMKLAHARMDHIPSSMMKMTVDSV